MGLELTIWCHIQTPIFGQRPAGRSVYCWLKFHGRVFVDRSQLQFFIGKISGRTHWAKNNSPIRINGSVASGRIIKSQIKPTLKLYCIGQKHKWKPFIRIRTTTIRNKTDPKHSLNVCYGGYIWFGVSRLHCWPVQSDVVDTRPSLAAEVEEYSSEWRWIIEPVVGYLDPTPCPSVSLGTSNSISQAEQEAIRRCADTLLNLKHFAPKWL